jgi:hypothetical protein
VACVAWLFELTFLLLYAPDPQAGIRCAAVADWPRACAHFKNSLEASILLYGKMDARTISVAKLLHSARKGRAEGEAGAGEPEDGEEGEAGFPGGGAREEDMTYGAGNVNATPRTIEVASSNEANPAYKGALAVITSKPGKYE